MTEEYLDIDLNSDKVASGLSAFVKTFSTKLQDVPIQKKRGGLNQITDLRAKTATMLDKPIEQVYGLTKNWTIAQLYEIYHIAEQYSNPAPIWWTVYKKKKHIYGKTNKKEIRGMGQKRRNENGQVGQKTLF